MKWCRLLLLFALVAAAPARADKERAKELFRKGMMQYTIDHFDEAIQSFEAAYAEEASPVFLFNIAQAHRLAKRPRPALEFYRKYLRESPQAKNRAQVEEQIAALEAQVKELDEKEAAEKARAAAEAEKAAEAARAAQLARTPPPEATRPPPPSEKPPAAKKRWPLWLGIGGAAVVVVGAAIAIPVALTLDHATPMEPQLPLENAR